ncbi:hypothetical protein IO99_00700 [Clostridium sulfidigenes]|uniref:Uncharacterized protein n=1 Tax=Clostridium sulfidigenes TaxID=318464 RepID=A0A084JIE3_9CLOT|nr:hypothetical protein [Clostridium sulfidigenes]KEZ88727.1 hypothetical protein IO99_00700 [Clostridium sulfidigenes]HAR84339.1 hypothetical protein [Clostridium sp.]
MNQLKINQISIVTFPNVGELNEKKFRKIVEHLSEFIIGSNGNTISFNFRVGENAYINVTKDSIQYQIIGEGIEKENIEKESIELMLTKVYDSLMVEELNFSVIDVQALAPSNNSLEESLKTLNLQFEVPKGTLKGIGYRFLIEGDNYNDDLKKEPFLSDPRFTYYQLTRNFNKNKINLKTVINDLYDTYNTIGEYFK